MRTGTTGRRARRRSTPELKAGAVRLVLDEGKSIGAVARELDLTPSALGGWVARARAEAVHLRGRITYHHAQSTARSASGSRAATNVALPIAARAGGVRLCFSPGVTTRP